MYPPHRTPGRFVTSWSKILGDQKALRSRKKLENVSVQTKKKERAKTGEMEHYMIQHLPQSDLRWGWTGGEMDTHQSSPTRGTWGRFAGQQGRGSWGKSHAETEEAGTSSSPRCIFCLGPSSAGPRPALCPVYWQDKHIAEFQLRLERWVLMWLSQRKDRSGFVFSISSVNLNSKTNTHLG